MTIATGTVLAERWELTSRLASGGMGDVYQAQDRQGGDDVAIKVLRSGVVQGEERFAGEIRMLRNMDHPHVVAVVDAGEEHGTPYLVMELLPGRSLADLLLDEKLDLQRVRRIGAAIASALAYAHARGVINRDLKPSNILFAEDGTAKLADFGIAKLMDASGITVTGQALGTASYIAPEQLSAPDEVGPPTDVYSLGLVLLEAATGQRAFVGSGTEAAMARLARDPKVPDDLPDTWRRLLRAMTAREPDLRPSAEEVAMLLGDDLPEEAVQTLVVPPVRVDDATRPMAMPPAAASSSQPPGRDETQIMGEQTHALAGAGAAQARGTDPSSSDAAPTRVTRPPRSTPAPRKRSGAAPWLLVILLLLVIAAGVVFFVLGGADDPADEPELDAPSEVDDPPEEEPPPDEPEPEEPEPEEPAEEEEPPEEPEPEPDEPEEEPAPDEEGPGGGPPDDTPGDPQGPPDDGDEGAGEDDGADSSLPLDPTEGLDELEL